MTQYNLSKIPGKVLVQKLCDELYDYLFSIENGMGWNDDLSEERTMRLVRILSDTLHPVKDSLNYPLQDVCTKFIGVLHEIRIELLKDCNFFVASDPAVDIIEEVIAAYPGFYAIAIYRLANKLYKLEVPILPRSMCEYAHSKTGIDIHPGAQIQSPFFIDHGTGVVIGQTTVIGQNVKMYQGVTLGALAVSKSNRGIKRHPTIEDNVVLYAGCCILGGDTIIGNNSIIGGNVWLTQTVPAHSVVYHRSEVTIRDASTMKNVIDFVI